MQHSDGRCDRREGAGTFVKRGAFPQHDVLNCVASLLRSGSAAPFLADFRDAWPRQPLQLVLADFRKRPVFSRWRLWVEVRYYGGQTALSICACACVRVVRLFFPRPVFSAWSLGAAESRLGSVLR